MCVFDESWFSAQKYDFYEYSKSFLEYLNTMFRNSVFSAWELMLLCRDILYWLTRKPSAQAWQKYRIPVARWQIPRLARKSFMTQDVASIPMSDLSSLVLIASNKNTGDAPWRMHDVLPRPLATQPCQDLILTGRPIWARNKHCTSTPCWKLGQKLSNRQTVEKALVFWKSEKFRFRCFIRKPTERIFCFDTASTRATSIRNDCERNTERRMSKCWFCFFTTRSLAAELICWKSPFAAAPKDSFTLRRQ